MNTVARDQAVVADGADDSGREWRKSSRSYGAGECIEVAAPYGVRIDVRDSKNPQGPVLRFTPGEWRVFTASVRIGQV
ncbi:MAG TPA: DUF397 domain-containing protein [Trebonia sp.]|nr:DUF397 domain-containing protein [Trebonia sp.]